MLAACFPIKYEDTDISEAHTVQLSDISHITVVLNETSGRYEVFDSGFSSADPVFLLNADGTYSSDGNDVGSLTFGANDTPAAAGTTQVLGFTPTYALQDRAVNQVTLGSGVDRAVFKFPAKTQGKARDFMLRLVITGSDVPEIGFVENDGTTEVGFDADDDSWADIEQGVNILMFTDTQEASA